MQAISNDFLTLIGLASAGARGTPFSTGVVDWDQILHFASEQAVLPLVGSALLKNPDIECPGEIRSGLITYLHQTSSSNMLRRQRILSLVKDLTAHSFQVQMIKGYVIAECYAYPESRTSADVDLLIPRGQESAVCSYLCGLGFTIEARSLTSHHTVCRHPKYGMVELHINLYDELVEDIWFQKRVSEFIQEKPASASMTDGDIPTLGYTDHLIFLSLHMIKHFISNGMSLGMMLDIVLFISKHADHIDFARYWKVLIQTGYATVISCVLQLLAMYGGFSDVSLSLQNSVSDKQLHALLEDLLCGGRMGFKEKDARLASAYEYNRLLMRRSGKSWGYIKYMLVWKCRSLYRGFFPTRDHLIRRYPYLKNRMWLLPAAWASRLIHGFKAIGQDKSRVQIRSEHTELSEVSRRRIGLFRDLEML